MFAVKREMLNDCISNGNSSIKKKWNQMFQTENSIKKHKKCFLIPLEDFRHVFFPVSFFFRPLLISSPFSFNFTCLVVKLYFARCWQGGKSFWLRTFTVSFRSICISSYFPPYSPSGQEGDSGAGMSVKGRPYTQR